MVTMKEAFLPPPGEFERKRAALRTACRTKGAYTMLSRLNYCDG